MGAWAAAQPSLTHSAVRRLLLPLLDGPDGLRIRACALSRRDVEVRDILTDTEFRIGRDSRLVVEIGLNEYNPCAPRVYWC